jgi:hypothetical protein
VQIECCRVSFEGSMASLICRLVGFIVGSV